MNINTLTKDEMASHLADVIDSQDRQIGTLKSERTLLWYLLAFTLTFTILF